ncbi:MAG: thiol reductant ABC exporter subunit CydD [Streptosporangiaceae bacterium]
MKPVDRRLLRHARAARGYLAVVVVLGLVLTALVLAQAGLLARALAGAAPGVGAVALWPVLVSLLAVVLARAVAVYGGEVAALRASASVKSQLRRRLAAQVLRLGPAWLGGQRTGEIATLATRGLDALDPYFARYLPQLVLACLVPLAVAVRVALADWISALIIVVTLPLIPVFTVLVGLPARVRARRQWLLLARLGGHFLDVVEGLTTLKLFGRARPQAEVIGRVTDEHRTATMSVLRVAFLSALVLELTAALATALVAVEVGLRLLGGHIGYEAALLVLLLTPEAFLPLRAVAMHFHASMEGMAAAGRVCDLLDIKLPRTGEGPRASAAVDLAQQTITLDGVCLSYPGRDRPALDGVSLTIAPGERIAVSGASGAGKSSLLALLLRFVEPSDGRIEAGGLPLDSIAMDAWRRQIAWVPQYPALMSGSVAANIALGQASVSRDAIAFAAGLAGADGFIRALPHGYDTPLGERGLRLSAGQRQRIALARAFLRDAPLLLLDEPTAHLDPVTAGQILDAVERLMAGRTVILVSHGIRWPGGADRTLTLDGGRVVLAAGCMPALEVTR